MRKSAKYFLNNNGKKLLAASVMALLLSGSAQPVLAASAEILDGTANDKYAQVNSGDIYGTVYGVRNDADASGGTIKMKALHLICTAGSVLTKMRLRLIIMLLL